MGRNIEKTDCKISIFEPQIEKQYAYNKNVDRF